MTPLRQSSHTPIFAVLSLVLILVIVCTSSISRADFRAVAKHGLQSASTIALQSDSSSHIVQRLRKAYPAQNFSLSNGAKGPQLCNLEGKCVSLGGSRPGPTTEEWYDNATLYDQLSGDYRRGASAEPLSDIGRARCEAFFAAMYGTSAKAVRSRTRSIRWVDGTMLVFSTVNGVATHMESIVNELKRKDSSLLDYLRKPGGSLVWRQVAGTNRRSAHSYGIAIDINVAHSSYWRNSGSRHYVNRIPAAIVECFERHGFIWGGKWEHFDSMHFEYRPELCAPLCSCAH